MFPSGSTVWRRRRSTIRSGRRPAPAAGSSRSSHPPGARRAAAGAIPAGAGGSSSTIAKAALAAGIHAVGRAPKAVDPLFAAAQELDQLHRREDQAEHGPERAEVADVFHLRISARAPALLPHGFDQVGIAVEADHQVGHASGEMVDDPAGAAAELHDRVVSRRAQRPAPPRAAGRPRSRRTPLRSR